MLPLLKKQNLRKKFKENNNKENREEEKMVGAKEMKEQCYECK